MRHIIRTHRHQRGPLMGVVALALALAAVVEVQLLLRPRSSSKDGRAVLDDDAAADGMFGRERRRDTQQVPNTAKGLTLAGSASEAANIPAQRQYGSTSSLEAPKQGGNTSAADLGGTLHTMRGAKLVFITFGNSAFTQFVSNWVASIQRLHLPFLVGALDSAMADVCKHNSWPHLDVSVLVKGNSTFFRANFAAFRSMGATKVQLVLTLLERLGIEMVMVSDSDTSWLGDPTKYLEAHPSVDMYISTDCLSHHLEEAWQAAHMQPRCGHIPGNSWGRAFNTGIFAVRNRKVGRQLLVRWRDLLLDPTRRTVMTWSNTTLGITDQLALNMVLDAAIPRGPVIAAPDDDRVLLLGWAPNDTLRLHPLPVILFASGHVAFVQRLPWRHSVDPFVVHATFQRYSVALQQIGKRARFREFGMWFLDGREYYDPPAARYLTYTNDVRRVIDEVAASPRFNGAMPVLYKQMVAASYQLSMFRDALAAARMLNRTLVLPTSWCWCDYDWTPHVLERCKIRGSDLQLPFECPADFIFHLPFMEQNGIDYRVPGFLEHPEVPEAVRQGGAEVHVLSAKPAAAADLAAPGLAGGTPLQPGSRDFAMLWPRMKQAQLVAALQPLSQTRVLVIRGMRPGLLEGFSSLEEQAAYDILHANITKELYWCCAAQAKDPTWNGFLYELPQPFAAGYSAWQAPVLPMPSYCDQVDDPITQEFINYDNHPCKFLRNATAAALAAQIT